MTPARVAMLALVLTLCACATATAPTPSPSIAGAENEADTSARTAARGAVGPERLVASESLQRPAQPILAARYEAALLADHCVDRDVPAPAVTDVALTVLDRSYALPAGYAPGDLVAASSAGLTGSSGTKLVRSVIVDDLAAMHAAWEKAGLSMIVESAYRSHASQAATFANWVAQLGEEGARLRTARPGHSEHQLGTAIDLSSPGWGGRFGDWAREAPEGAWMAEHAWEYGFVMSYPSGSQDATCFGYEPWHYRWIGREAAEAHRASGEYLRQFLLTYVDA